MAILSRATLKALWITLFQPAETNYDDVWDSHINKTDDFYLEDVVAGTNITIDKTDPKNPIIASTGGGASDTPQAWSTTMLFDANYGSFNTNAHTQTAQITFAITWTSALFGVTTSRIIKSNGDDFVFPAGYITINADSATGTKAINTFTPIADKQYRVVFECVDVSNQKYNALILDFETTTQLNAPVLTSATLDSGVDIDLVYTDTNSYPPEVQVEIQYDTVVTFDSGSEASVFAAKDSTAYGVTLPLIGTLYYFRLRAVGNNTDTQTSAWSNIESESTGTSIIVMQDDFAGTTIDSGKWTETDPVDGVTITQNDELIFTSDGTSPVASANTNNVVSIDTITTGCIQTTIGGDNGSNVQFFRLYSNLSPLYFAEVIRLVPSSNAQLRIFVNGVQEYLLLTSESFLGTWKIFFDESANNVYFYKLTAPDTWTQVGTTQNFDIDDGSELKAQFGANAESGTGTRIFNSDDFFLTLDNYTTSQPL